MNALAKPKLTALQVAWEQYCLKIHANQPRDLRFLNSPAALSGRACDLDAQISACTEWLYALVEDTADHVNFDRAALTKIVTDHMGDMASDIRGLVVQAIHQDTAWPRK